MPLRPKAVSRATPPTTGGSTIGSTVNARSTARPGKATRARIQASGTPNAIAMAVADSEASSDRRRAVSDSVEVSRAAASVQGARSSRPSSGSRKKATPSPASTVKAGGAEGRPRSGREEAVGSKRLLAVSLRIRYSVEDVGDERLRERNVGRFFENRDRIARHHVETVGNVHSLEAAGSLDVGDVDDAGVGFSQRHLAEHRLHVGFLAGSFHAYSSALQRLGGITTAGYGRGAEYQHKARTRQVLKTADVARVSRPYHN